MTKYVRDTKAAQTISAYVILKRGKPVAEVLVHHGASVLVNVFQRDHAALRCAKGDDKLASEFVFQVGRAGGCGYDRLTAALAGLCIDGHRLTDHCEVNKRPPRGHKVWPKNAKPPRGFQFANYHAEFHTFGFNSEKHPNPNFCGEEGYSACYRISGLKILEAFGYTVVQAL